MCSKTPSQRVEEGILNHALHLHYPTYMQIAVFLSMTLTEMGKNLCVITCEMDLLSLQCKHIITFNT